MHRKTQESSSKVTGTADTCIHIQVPKIVKSCQHIGSNPRSIGVGILSSSKKAAKTFGTPVDPGLGVVKLLPEPLVHKRSGH